VPGYESLATVLMKQTIKNNGVASIAELRDLCREADVKMIACQMTVELFGFEHSDFIDGLEFAVPPRSSSLLVKRTYVCLSEIS